MAAPAVAGTVALMFQAAGRAMSVTELRRLLIGSLDPLPGPPRRSSSRLGYGYLNVRAAVVAARSLRVEALEQELATPECAGCAGDRQETDDLTANLSDLPFEVQALLLEHTLEERSEFASVAHHERGEDLPSLADGPSSEEEWDGHTLEVDAWEDVEQDDEELSPERIRDALAAQ